MNNSLLMNEKGVDAAALGVLFHEARTANGFTSTPVPRNILDSIVEAAHLGPTAVNSTPLRVVFVTSPEAKERLVPALSPGNVAKTREAPVTAIIAHDLRFHEHLPRLFPHMDLSHIGKNAATAEQMSAYNAALQTGYFILAARAFGLDAGPMGGFDKEAVDREFFPGGTVKSDLLINLGYADDSKLYPRNPRLEVEDVASYI